MIDGEKLVAFTLVTATTSLVPGPSMLFVMGQSIWRGARSGWAALLGMQVGYFGWWILAALGLGAVAKAYPEAFFALALAGIVYLAWIGISAIRHSFGQGEDDAGPAREPSRHAFRDGMAVAFGNPKSLVYMVAIIPPFVQSDRPLVPQIALLAIVALVADLLIGALYIGAGRKVSSAMERAATRKWVDRAMGCLFLAIALAILADVLRTT